jgi:predicted O-methyltransferase YrrM
MPERRILTDAVADYLDWLEPAPDDLLAAMEADAEEHDVPIPPRQTSRFVALLARSAAPHDAGRPGRALEVGTAIGYTALHLARAGVDVTTIERDPAMIERAEDYLERGGVRDRVEILEGDALPTIQGLAAQDEADGDADPFDLLYLDANKEGYGHQLAAALPLLREGGLVVADNLLWYGQVAEGPQSEAYEESTAALRTFNEHFVSHDALEAVVTPLGDGVGVAVKRGVAPDRP